MADYFLKIDGIEGESSDAHHKNVIEVESFSWSEQHQGSGGGPHGGGAGRAVPSAFHFTARVSKASPKLMLACATGHFSAQAVLTARKSGQVQFEFLSIKLTDVQVAAYEISAASSNDSLPMDSVSLSFNSLQMSYTVQQPNGSPGENVVEGFDFRNNRKI